MCDCPQCIAEPARVSARGRDAARARAELFLSFCRISRKSPFLENFARRLSLRGRCVHHYYVLIGAHFLISTRGESRPHPRPRLEIGRRIYFFSIFVCGQVWLPLFLTINTYFTLFVRFFYDFFICTVIFALFLRFFPAHFLTFVFCYRRKKPAEVYEKERHFLSVCVPTNVFFLPSPPPTLPRLTSRQNVNICHLWWISAGLVREHADL